MQLHQHLDFFLKKIFIFLRELIFAHHSPERHHRPHRVQCPRQRSQEVVPEGGEGGGRGGGGVGRQGHRGGGGGGGGNQEQEEEEEKHRLYIVAVLFWVKISLKYRIFHWWSVFVSVQLCWFIFPLRRAQSKESRGRVT